MGRQRDQVRAVGAVAVKHQDDLLGRPSGQRLQTGAIDDFGQNSVRSQEV